MSVLCSYLLIELRRYLEDMSNRGDDQAKTLLKMLKEDTEDTCESP